MEEKTNQAQTETFPGQLPPEMKSTLRDLLPVILTELILTGVMLGVYALCGRLGKSAVLGAALGAGVSLLNFLGLIFGLLRAEKKDNPLTAQVTVRAQYVARLVLMLVVLVIALKSALFDPLATLLPLCFMRLALFAPRIGRRKRR